MDVASKVVAKVYSKKRLADTAGIESYKVILCAISFVLALLFMGIIYVAIDMDNLWLEIAAYCAIFAAFTILVPLSFIECFRDSSKKFISFNKSVKEQLDLYFSKVNGS